jgi:tetratricopeptide (TPR) repeat protein
MKEVRSVDAVSPPSTFRLIRENVAQFFLLLGVLIIALALADVASERWPQSGIYIYGALILALATSFIATFFFSSKVIGKAALGRMAEKYLPVAVDMVKGTQVNTNRPLDPSINAMLGLFTIILGSQFIQAFFNMRYRIIALTINALAVCVIGFVVTFSEFFRFWNVQFGGFQADGLNYWDWLRFGISWVLDNGLANFDQIFGVSVSDTHPTNLMTKSLVWGFNVMLEVIVIASVIRAFQGLRDEGQFVEGLNKVVPEIQDASTNLLAETLTPYVGAPESPDQGSNTVPDTELPKIDDQPRDATLPELKTTLKRLLGQYKYEEAVLCFQRIVELSGSEGLEWHEWFGIAKAYGQLGKHADEAVAYDKAVAADPDPLMGAVVLGMKGRELASRHRCEEAIAAINSSFERDEENMRNGIAAVGGVKFMQAGLMGVKAKCLVRLGRYKEADEVLNQAVKVDAQVGWDFYEIKCEALLGLGKCKRAVKCYDGALKQRPDLSSSWANKARALMCLRRYKDALAAGERAVSLDPKSAEAWTVVQSALEKLGREDEALIAAQHVEQNSAN